MKITVYTISYNEELLIQFMIDHYRSRFPQCNIIFYDNSSTDNTVKIAYENNCQVITYNSGGTLNDGLHTNIKNTCWKNAPTDWVLVSDLDELLDINEQELEQEEQLGSTRIKSEGYHMVNLQDNYDIQSIKYGTRNYNYDKYMLFNKRYIQAMNYEVGAHQCRSVGQIVDSRPYKMYHYKFINPELSISKHHLTFQR
jgi:glycosyltransferase involved in cell wall biosynthesis